MDLTRKIPVLLIAFLHQTFGLNFDFNQHLYRFNTHSCEGLDYNKHLYAYFDVKPFRTRKDGYFINITFEQTEDVDNFKILINAEQFISNVFKPSNIRFDLNGCDGLKNFGVVKQLMTTNGNLTECPIKKGIYMFYNYALDSTKMPPLLPEGGYKFIITTMLIDNTLMQKFAIYGNIEYYMNKNKKTGG